MLDNDETKYYWRRIPHIQPKDATLFLTFRLSETMPNEIIRQFNDYKLQISKTTKDRSDYQNVRQKKIFAFYDSLLCKSDLKNNFLSNSDISQIFADTLHEFDGTLYNLFCYTIMPNHVHILFRILNRESGEPHEMAFIVKKIKSITTREINRIIGSEGRFWQREYYDYCARSETEMLNITNYILLNPVKAGLVKEASEWKWSWVCEL